MRKKILIVFLFIVCVIVAYAANGIIKNKKVAKIETAQATKIRIGWQIPWATEGQLTQILKQTDI